MMPADHGDFEMTINQINKTILAGILASTLGAVLGGATPAIAEDGPPSVTISYDDLDLRSQAGRDALDGRIRAAVKKVCARDVGAAGAIAWYSCRRYTLRSANNQRDVAIARARGSGGPEVAVADSM